MEISLTLIICPLLLIVAIILYLKNYKDAGIFIAFGVIIIGFGLIGSLSPEFENKIKINNYTIFKSKYRVIIDTQYGIKVLEKMKYKDIKKEDINVYLLQYKNAYGIQLSNNGDNKLKIEMKEEY